MTNVFTGGLGAELALEAKLTAAVISGVPPSLDAGETLFLLVAMVQHAAVWQVLTGCNLHIEILPGVQAIVEPHLIAAIPDIAQRMRPS